MYSLHITHTSKRCLDANRFIYLLQSTSVKNKIEKVPRGIKHFRCNNKLIRVPMIFSYH